MSNISVPDSIEEPSVGWVEAAVEAGEQSAAFSFSGLVAFLRVLDVFGDRLLAVHMLVVIEAVYYVVVVGPGGGRDKYHVYTVIERILFNFSRYYYYQFVSVQSDVGKWINYYNQSTINRTTCFNWRSTRNEF